MRLAGLATAAALLAVATPALGCSMAPGYKVPTNLELAARGEVIVVAEVVGERAGATPWDNRVETVPRVLLKGAALPSAVVLEGASLESDPRLVVASDPRELRRPNPGALIGGCVRRGFAKGMLLVLFLARDERGVLAPHRSSFSRDAEDVPSADALWVKAVREYAAIGAAPRAEWNARLRARMAQLQADPADADALAIARDMAVEVRGKRLPPFD